MRTILIAAAPVILWLAPGPTWAASGDIGCIEAKLGPAAMQRIGANVVAAADKRGDPARVLDVDRDALIAARSACRTAANWSPDAVQTAVSYTQARATKLGAEMALKADGLDPARLSGVYAALPLSDRKTLVDAPSSGAKAALNAVAPDQRQRVHVQLLFAALSAIEFYPQDFARQ